MKKTPLPKLLLIKNADIIDPVKSEQYMGSILLKNGKIEKIEKIENNIALSDTNILDANGKIVTHGFCDLHVHFREPGRKDKETLLSGAKAAIFGGFTEVCTMPNTNPPIDNPESIRLIVDKAKSSQIKIHPIGAISIGQKGEKLTELSTMVNEGAVAFSDDGIPVMNSGLMRRVLEYSLPLSVPIINHAEDLDLKVDGQMHEGFWSTCLGLTGIPDISESIMVNRDIELLDFTNGRLHIPHVSSAKSIEYIKKAKENELNVSSEVTPHHLYFTDEDLQTYNTNFKVAPPIRTEDNRKKLIQALKIGIIDCIATDHAPHTIQEKEEPFDLAPCGMIGLESAFGAIWKVLSEAKMDLIDIISCLTVKPRQVMGFDKDLFRRGSNAQIVIIDPNEEWEFNLSSIYSKSRNSPFIGEKLKGKIKTTISKGFFFEM